ncbi:MAG: hypothetical protein LBV03_07415 [Fusobacteriales bacterium]|jgi:hypothetical protein|nr:hypothetical protein [Fusobacteriales bacterium]
MIKQFLLNRKRKKLKKSKEWINNLQIIRPAHYEISEVEMEVLKQGNRKLYIQHLKNYRVLKIKKKLDRVLNDTEIQRINEVLNNIYFEEVDGKLYFFTYINLYSVKGFDSIKNSIEVFKRKAGIVQGILWS